MFRAFTILAVCLTAGWFPAFLGAAESPDPAGIEFFEKKIRPVLVKHCYECHSADSDSAQGGFLLDTRTGIRRGGDSGPAVIPGKTGESLLLEALRYESFEMPPEGKLPDAVVADFEKWIRMGAPDPRDGQSLPVRTGVDLEQGRQFWSFQPIRKPEIPEVRDATWPRTDVDRFILARLEASGLAPVEDADRRTLIRRVYFDLIGLPPTPEDVLAFLEDDSPDAFEKTVDRLLESPRFGERWGRHWLDVVRYAESSGGGRTRIFENAWRYRDYVIESFNSDKPFDQFTIEQIAGDLLSSDSLSERRDQLVATSFLVLGPINYELQDKELLDMEVVDEQLNTIGRAFLGMTISCARCHDHKFDPIPTRDYYAMAGIFRSTQTLKHANVSNLIERTLPLSEAHERALAAYRKAAGPLEKDIKQGESRLKKLQQQLSGMFDGVNPSRLLGIVVDNTQAEFVGNWSSSSGNPQFIGADYQYSGKGNGQARFRVELDASGWYEVRLAHNAHPNRASNVPVRIHHADGTKVLRVNHRESPPIDDLFVSLGRYRFDAAEPAEVVVACEDVDGAAIADAVQFIAADILDNPEKLAEAQAARSRNGSGLAADHAARVRSQIAEVKSTLDDLKGRLAKLKKNAPPPAPITMSVQEGKEPGDCPLCIRGNVHNQGEPVPRGVLQVASRKPALDIPAGRSGRLQFAQWLVGPDNPLTARVFVNRVWHHLFGAGLVRTVDNFGSMGEPPSHPELLDHLAHEFVAQGWSVKSLLRRIMLSRVYRLSSQVAPAQAEIDPENRLLSRMNRQRLEAEAIRDAMLVVSGQLDPAQGGSTIKPGTTTEFGYEFTTLRRSVYIPVFRNTLHEVFEVFDFADPNLVMGRRNTSTLPTQALYLMNSPFVMEQAEHAARRLLESESPTDADRIVMAYEQALGRPPTDSERQLALEFLSDVRFASGGDDSAETEVQAWAGLYQALFACLDFRYLK